MTIMKQSMFSVTVSGEKRPLDHSQGVFYSLTRLFYLLYDTSIKYFYEDFPRIEFTFHHY
jgi:hypothetical protein